MKAAEQFVLASIVSIDLSVRAVRNRTVNFDEKSAEEPAEIRKIGRNPAPPASLYDDHRLAG